MTRTINDEMWFFVMPVEFRLTAAAAGGDIVFSIVIPQNTSWDDCCFYMERMSTAIWGVVGEHGVFQEHQ